jgi:acyl dehydratase
MQADSQLYFNDFSVGAVYPGQSRRLGEEEFRLFAQITGDAHPIHYDPEYAASTVFGKRVAHGLLVMAMSALGATALSERLREAMVAFVEQGCRFMKPILIDETVRTELEVESVQPKSGNLGLVRFIVRIYRSDGEVALLGHHSYLLKRRIGTP